MAHNGGRAGGNLYVIAGYYFQPFINMCKAQLGGWQIVGGSGTDHHGYFDEYGYPNAMPGGGGTWSTVNLYVEGVVGDFIYVEMPMGKTFALSSAEGSFTLGSATTVQTSPTIIKKYEITGIPTYSYYAEPGWSTSLAITAMDDGTWTTPIRVYLERYLTPVDYVNMSGIPGIFKPEFLTDFAVGSLRNLNQSSAININFPLDWDQRSTTAQYTYAGRLQRGSLWKGTAAKTAGKNRYTLGSELTLTDGLIINFYIDTVPTSLAVASVVKGNPTQLNFTTNHGLSNGEFITNDRDDTGGAVWAHWLNVKDSSGLMLKWEVTVVDTDSVTIPLDTTLFDDPIGDLAFHPIMELADSNGVTKRIMRPQFYNNYQSQWPVGPTYAFYDATFDCWISQGNWGIGVGFPYELWCDLCVYLGAKPYFTLPLVLSDDWHTGLFELVKSKFAGTGIIPDFEVGNETWNFITEQDYLKSYCLKFFPAEDEADHIEVGTAMRVIEIADLLDAVFTDPNTYTHHLGFQGGTAGGGKRWIGDAAIQAGPVGNYAINRVDGVTGAIYAETAFAGRSDAADYPGWTDTLALYDTGTAAAKKEAFEWFANELIARSSAVQGNLTLTTYLSIIASWVATRTNNPTYVGRHGTGYDLQVYEMNTNIIGPNGIDGGLTAGQITICRNFLAEYLRSYEHARFVTYMLNKVTQAGVSWINWYALEAASGLGGNWNLIIYNGEVREKPPAWYAFKDFCDGITRIQSHVLPYIVPVNTSPPTIVGIPQVGVASTCDPGEYVGTAPPPTFSYQWKVDGSNVGTDSAQYTPVGGDAAKQLTCAVTPSNSEGPASPLTATAQGLVGHTAALLNSADKSSRLTLSGGDLVAEKTTSGSTYDGVRATKSASSGKYYREITAVNVSTTGGYVVGIGNASMAINTGVYPGQTLNSISYAANGNVLINNVQQGPIQTFTDGSIVCEAVDLDNMKIWWRIGNGNWNNDVIGNQNPATNTGGIDISGLNAGPYFPILSMFANGEIGTVNFGASPFAYTPPSGFGLL